MSIHLDGCLATFSKSWIREVYSNEPHNYVCHSNTNHLIWKHFYDESHWFCASCGVVMLPFTFKKDDPPLATIGFANKISEEKKGINPQTIRVQNDNNSSTMMNEPTLQKSRRYTRRFCPLKELYAWEEVRANYISIKPTKKKYFIQQMSHTKKKNVSRNQTKETDGRQVRTNEHKLQSEIRFVSTEPSFTCFKCWRNMSVLTAPRRERRESVPR